MKRFNRTIKGVGRIANSSGTDNPREFANRDALLTKLIRARALDVLREFKVGRITIGDLLTADREERLSQVAADVRLARPLFAAVEAWLPDSAAAPQSRRRYATSWAALTKKAKLRKSMSVRDLSLVPWKALEHRWTASPSDWNKMRAMLSAFLSAFTGSKYSPFRLEVMGRVACLEENEGRTTDLAVADLWKLYHAVPKEHAQAAAEVRAAWVAMAATGAGPKEFIHLTSDSLLPGLLQVGVQGFKKGRKRVRMVSVQEWLWPYVAASVPCPLAYKWLRIHFKRAAVAIGRPDLTLLDLRHLYGQLAVDQGASLRDVAQQMGHKDLKTTLRYARRKDAVGVAAKVGEGLKQPVDGTR